MSAGVVLERAVKYLSGIHGGIALALEKREPLTKAQVAEWVRNLRRAADELERLMK